MLIDVPLRFEFNRQTPGIAVLFTGYKLFVQEKNI